MFKLSRTKSKSIDTDERATPPTWSPKSSAAQAVSPSGSILKKPSQYDQSSAQSPTSPKSITDIPAQRHSIRFAPLPDPIRPRAYSTGRNVWLEYDDETNPKGELSLNRSISSPSSLQGLRNDEINGAKNPLKRLFGNKPNQQDVVTINYPSVAQRRSNPYDSTRDEFVEWDFDGMKANRHFNRSSVSGKVGSKGADDVLDDELDDGSGMAWLRKRRAEREAKKALGKEVPFPVIAKSNSFSSDDINDESEEDEDLVKVIDESDREELSKEEIELEERFAKESRMTTLGAGAEKYKHHDHSSETRRLSGTVKVTESSSKMVEEVSNHSNGRTSSST